MDEILKNKLQNYLKEARCAFMWNGDLIKFDKNQNIQEVFSPRYGYNFMPEEVLNGIRRCYYSWSCLKYIGAV
jgi:hypothetical protein